MVLPRLWDRHHDGLGQRSSCHQEELEHGVEGSGIGAVWLANGEAFFQVSIEEVGFNHALSRCHPVHVAAQGVDFSIVRHESVRLRPVPGGEGIGGEA